jgi:hypothetical protein
MKRILNIAIVSVLLYANIGYIIGYFVTLQHIKNDQFNSIRNSQNYEECIKFVMDESMQNQIHYDFWNSNEFEFKGKMYDIVSSLNTDGYKVIYALMDKHESSFLENFIAFMDKQIHGKSNVVYFFKFISNIELDNLLDSFNITRFEMECNKLMSQVFFTIQHCFLEILKPPPNSF